MNATEFIFATQRAINDVHFDTDVVVSTFETNIRVLGGLLGAHSAMREIAFRERRGQISFSASALSILRSYKRGLLDMAVDLVRLNIDL